MPMGCWWRVRSISRSLFLAVLVAQIAAPIRSNTSGLPSASCRRLFTSREVLLECEVPPTQGAWYFQEGGASILKQAERGHTVVQVLVGKETVDTTTSTSTGLLFYDVRAALDGIDVEIGTGLGHIDVREASFSCVCEDEAAWRGPVFELKTVNFDWMRVTDNDELHGRISFPSTISEADQSSESLDFRSSNALTQELQRWLNGERNFGIALAPAARSQFLSQIYCTLRLLMSVPPSTSTSTPSTPSPRSASTVFDAPTLHAAETSDMPDERTSGTSRGQERRPAYRWTATTEALGPLPGAVEAGAEAEEQGAILSMDVVAALHYAVAGEGRGLGRGSAWVEEMQLERSWLACDLDAAADSNSSDGDANDANDDDGDHASCRSKEGEASCKKQQQKKRDERRGEERARARVRVWAVSCRGIGADSWAVDGSESAGAASKPWSSGQDRCRLGPALADVHDVRLQSDAPRITFHAEERALTSQVQRWLHGAPNFGLAVTLEIEGRLFDVKSHWGLDSRRWQCALHGVATRSTEGEKEGLGGEEAVGCGSRRLHVSNGEWADRKSVV